MFQEKCQISPKVFLFYKPKGITSFQFVQRVKRELRARKAGHAGTLDPLAEGLMIIGIDEGTKLLKNFLKLNKVYLARITLGESRTTGDLEGEIYEEVDYRGDIDEHDIVQALESLRGEHQFPAPLYSAVKVKGKPLYLYARRGKKPPYIPLKPFFLFSYELLKIQEARERLYVDVRLKVSSGSYIRSFAEELGRRLSYPATLVSLAREQIGEYHLRDACNLNLCESCDTLKEVIRK